MPFKVLLEVIGTLACKTVAGEGKGTARRLKTSPIATEKQPSAN